jgi:hypothetical protein
LPLSAIADYAPRISVGVESEFKKALRYSLSTLLLKAIEEAIKEVIKHCLMSFFKTNPIAKSLCLPVGVSNDTWFGNVPIQELFRVPAYLQIKIPQLVIQIKDSDE